MGQERYGYKEIVKGILVRSGIGPDFERNEEVNTWEGQILQAMNNDSELKNSGSVFSLRENDTKMTFTLVTGARKKKVLSVERVLSGVQTGERDDATLSGIRVTEHKPEACGPFWRALEEHPMKVMEVVKKNKKSGRGGKTLSLAV